MKRTVRDRPLTPEEAAKYKAIREKVAAELPELVARHEERTASLDRLDEVVRQLKATREAKGLSLADMTERTGMDGASTLETGQAGRRHTVVDGSIRRPIHPPPRTISVPSGHCCRGWNPVMRTVGSMS